MDCPSQLYMECHTGDENLCKSSTSRFPHTYSSREFYLFDYVILGPEKRGSRHVYVKAYIFLVSVGHKLLHVQLFSS